MSHLPRLAVGVILGYAARVSSAANGVRSARLPGDRKVAAAPLRGGRRRPPTRTPQRPRGHAFHQRGKPTSREKVEREYRERFAGDGYWAAVEKATGEFVGWFALHPTEGDGPEGYELGYRLGRFAWGKGYA